MNNRTLISRSAFKVPFTVWKAGGTHPYAKTHISLRFVNPTVQKVQYVVGRTEGVTYNEWLHKGVAMPENKPLLISMDVQHDDHIVSIPVDLGLMKKPLLELARGNGEFSFGGACGLAVAKLFMDAAYSTDTLQEKDMAGNQTGSGLRIAQATLSLQESISRDSWNELGYQHILSWTQAMHIYTRIAGMESLGRLDEIKGVKGTIKIAREEHIANFRQVGTHSKTMGLAEEMGYLSLDISLPDIAKFDINFISGLIEKAISRRIYIPNFIFGIKEKSQKEAEVYLDRLIKDNELIAKAKGRRKLKVTEELEVERKAMHSGTLGPAKARTVKVGSSLKAKEDLGTILTKKRPATLNRKPLSPSGAKKDSAEEFYYELLRWARENNAETGITLLQFQKDWEGKTRGQRNKAFEKFKKDTLANKAKR